VTVTTLAPCGPFCTPACRAADAELHGAQNFPLDIADDGPEPEPAVHSGHQADHDIRAVQLRPENFSPKMVEKAGRLYVANRWSYSTIDGFEVDVYGDSGVIHEVRVWGRAVKFATCTCPARASRWNHAGACAHRALGAWLYVEQTGQPLDRWQDLTLVEAGS
jgi:hypothetical protein